VQRPLVLIRHIPTVARRGQGSFRFSELGVIEVDRPLNVNGCFPPPRLADVRPLRLGGSVRHGNVGIISSRCFIISLDRPPEKAAVGGRDLQDLLEK